MFKHIKGSKVILQDVVRLFKLETRSWSGGNLFFTDSTPSVVLDYIELYKIQIGDFLEKLTSEDFAEYLSNHDLQLAIKCNVVEKVEPSELKALNYIVHAPNDDQLTGRRRKINENN